MTPSSTLQLIANTIRGLSIDAIEAAGCGHPGLPLGCAEIGAFLFAKGLRYHPHHPEWINRDRFILSAGHGSMLLYAALHLSGYDLSLEDIRHFRRYHSPTAGHPEYREIPGIETTTGPLGQGFATGAGIALGQKMMEAQFELDSAKLLDAKVVILVGDGCMMEGITSETSSLSGHLQLENMIVIYDSNEICLDGPTHECFSENVQARYEAYGWDVQIIDGHHFEEIEQAYTQAHTAKGKPQLIIAKTVIGKGSPHYAGTSDVHGKALGKEETLLTKHALGIPAEPLFHVPEEVTHFFTQHLETLTQAYTQWQTDFSAWEAANPEKAQRFHTYLDKTLPDDFDGILKAIEIKPGLATRASSGTILQTLHSHLGYLVGGSADLSGSDNTWMKAGGMVSSGSYEGRNIKFGVREFAMAAMCSGLALQGMILPYCGTFFTFSDYMRNAIRLAALMKLRVIYQFTHDSIFLGEDGPTHQPVEHLASLRAMPHLVVIRPADATEVKGAWSVALSLNQPCALVLSRQSAPDLDHTKFEAVARGAYVVHREKGPHIDFCLLATGTEVHLAIECAKALEEKGRVVRVVSFPSFELFNRQDKAYKEAILGGNIRQFVSIEALVSFGWHQYIGRDGIAISVDTFGLSAPAKDLATHFGFTVERILAKLLL